MGAPRPHLASSGFSLCTGTAVALGSWSKAGGSWCPREQVRALGPSHEQSFEATGLDFPVGAHGEGAAGAAQLAALVLAWCCPAKDHCWRPPKDTDLARRGAALGFEQKYS